MFVSTPNVLTLAPKGAPRSDNPWHVHEYRCEEFEALCRAHFASVEMYGLFHARKLRAHEAALRLGWDRVHPRLRLTRRFYELVHARDRGVGLRAEARRARGRLRRWRRLRGTDLQALLTDSSGQLKVLVENPSGITAVTSVAGYREMALTEGTQNLLQTTLGGNLRTRDHSTSSVDDCIVVGSQYNQIEFDFSKTFNAAIITNSTDNGVNGTATQSGGAAIYATGAAASSYARGVSTQALSYRPGHEVYMKFTAGFTVGGAAGSHQRIGMVNGTAPSLSDGFNIGYEGTVWGISHWSGGSLIGGTANVVPSVARSAFNGDQCTGAAGSQFTRQRS